MGWFVGVSTSASLSRVVAGCIPPGGVVVLVVVGVRRMFSFGLTQTLCAGVSVLWERLPRRCGYIACCVVVVTVFRAKSAEVVSRLELCVKCVSLSLKV